MNRLTERNKQGDLMLCGKIVYGNNQDIYNAISLLEEYENTELDPEEVEDLKDCVEGEEGTQGTVRDLLELMQYRKLEEQGRLIKLPYKIGEKVYCVDSRTNEPFESEYSFYKYQHGINVFLTKEEAENKLKKMEVEKQ